MTVTDFESEPVVAHTRLCINLDFSSVPVRSMQGPGPGVPLMGITADTPNETANEGCDYGPWASQMLIRDQDANTPSTLFGTSNVDTWADQSYTHQILVR